MLSNYYGHEQGVLMHRQQTDAILAQPVLPDSNGLLADLAAVGYLRERHLGCAAALLMLVEDEAELLADDMPDTEDLTRNGGPHFTYKSVHFRLINVRDAINSSLPLSEYAPFNTGYVIDLDGTERKGRYFLEKSLGKVERMGPAARTELEQRGVEGVVNTLDMIDDEKFWNRGLTSPTEVMRVAAQWKSYTVSPPYNYHSQSYLERVMTEPEALQALQANLEDLQAEKVRHDIDIALEVMGLTS